MGVLKGRVKQLRLSSRESKRVGKFQYHWGAIIVVLIIVAAFVIAPVIPSFFGGKVYNFGSYKGIPIKFYPGSDMEKEVASLMREIPAQAQGAYRQFYLQQVWYTAFMRQAMRLAVSERLKQTALLVSQEKMNELLKSYPGFANSQGEFDLSIYKRYTAQQKANISKHLEKAYLWEHYERDIVETPVPRSFFGALQQMAQIQLAISWFKVTKEDIPLVDLQSFVKDKGELLYASDVILVAGSKEKELKKLLEGLQKEELNLEEISPEQKEDFEGALFYELANLVKDSERDNLTQEFSNGSTWTSVYPLSDSRYGFFVLQKPLHQPDLRQSVEKNKVLLYMQMQERPLYEEILQGLARNTYTQKTKCTDTISFNPASCNLYSSDMGGLAVFAGNEDFYKTVFALKEGQLTEPFLSGDEVYVFQLLNRIKRAPLEEREVERLLKNDLLYSLQEDLLNSKDFKNDFWQVYHKSGIAEFIASQL